MGTEFYSFEMLTGRRLTPLPASSGRWKITTNADESISCEVPARSAVAQQLRIWETTGLARTGLLVTVDDVPVAAGPLWKREYLQGERITLTAGGLRSYWARRILLPVTARTTPLINAAGDPDPSLDFSASNLDYGTIAKRYVQLVTAWPGGSIPLALPVDRTGTRVDTVSAVDLKTVKTLLDNLSGLINGPDIAFRPRWAADGLGIYWEMQTGTETQPRLGNPDPSLIKWTVGAPTGGAYGLRVQEDGTALAEEAFGLGGGSSDKVVAARARNAALADVGTPLLQMVDKGHSDVKLQASMQAIVDQDVNLGQYPASFWSMKVRAHEAGTPILGDYWLGDMGTVTVDPRDGVLPAGDYPRRVASISGQLNEDYEITFAEAVA